VIGGKLINVRELSSDSISVEASEPLAPCAGRIETLVGDERNVIDVQLLEGIDPSRDEQPIRILEIGGREDAGTAEFSATDEHA